MSQAVPVQNLSPSESSPPPNCEVLSTQFERVASDEIVFKSSSMGVSVESLRRLRIGWLASAEANTFPMWSPWKIHGIRIRVLTSGKKWSITGGHEGLFIPKGFNPRKPFMVCEGPTDTGTALDLGFSAIGKPSCRTGHDLILMLVRKFTTPFVTVCADNDEPKADGSRPGREGADQLMGMLAGCTQAVCIMPPDGIKDLRKWKQEGATRGDVAAEIRKYKKSLDCRRAANADHEQTAG